MSGYGPDGRANVPSAGSSRDSLAPEVRAVFRYKQEAVELAKQMAAEREKAYHEAKAAGLDAGPAPNFKPTWTDYVIAAERVGEMHAGEMKAQGIPWNAKVYSDLSSVRDSNNKTIPGYEMRLEGFQINKAHMEPPENMRRLAVIRASQKASDEGRKPSRMDALREIQNIQQSGEKVPPLESLRDMYDLDCDHAIGKLYSEIDHEADFRGTVFSKCNFHPADTLMRNGRSETLADNGIPITDGAIFRDVTFDGMSDKDTLTLNHGHYENITLKDINRGHVVVDKNSYIEGINIAGLNANFSIGSGAVVSHIAVDDKTRILTLNMEEGATIAHSDLREATISPSSKLQGTIWTDVRLGGNFRDADLSNSKLTKMMFDGADIKGSSFKNAVLNQVEFNNVNLPDLNLEDVKSFSGLMINGREVASMEEFKRMKQEAILSQQVAGIGKVLTREMNSIGQKTATPPIEEGLFADQGQATVIDTATPGAQLATAAQQPADIGSVSSIAAVAEGQLAINQVLARQQEQSATITGGQSVTLAEATALGNNTRAINEMDRPTPAPGQDKEGVWVRSLPGSTRNS